MQPLWLKEAAHERERLLWADTTSSSSPKRSPLTENGTDRKINNDTSNVVLHPDKTTSCCPDTGKSKRDAWIVLSDEDSDSEDEDNPAISNRFSSILEYYSMNKKENRVNDLPQMNRAVLAKTTSAQIAGKQLCTTEIKDIKAIDERKGIEKPKTTLPRVKRPPKQDEVKLKGNLLCPLFSSFK